MYARKILRGIIRNTVQNLNKTILYIVHSNRSETVGVINLLSDPKMNK